MKEKRKQRALLRYKRNKRNRARMGYVRRKGNDIDPARTIGISEIHSFGRNKFGMLGTGDTTGRLWPRRINFAGK